MSDERRTFGRIEANLACAIATPEASHEGRLENLSIGGAAVLGPPQVSAVGDSLGLSIDQPELDLSILLSAEVVRIEPRGDQTLYCLRFTLVSPADREALVALLRQLARSRGLGARRHARVHHRLDLICRSADEFRATLRDISHGGLALQCAKELAVGTPVVALMGFEDLRSLLKLPGTVVHVEPTGPGQFRAGVRFDPMSPERQRQVERLIDVLLGLAPRQGVLEEEDGGDPDEG